MREANKIIRMLLNHLPDTCLFDDDPSWDWAWNELSSDAQEKVSKTRNKALAFLESAPVNYRDES